MSDHTTKAFDADLQGIALKIAEMGRLDEQQIGDATKAFAIHDQTIAQKVIEADDRVDALQQDVEERTVSTIARRQPMARDLRAIVGALRIANDLERIGDLAENIAKRVIDLNDISKIDDVMAQLQRMVSVVVRQLRRVLECYERNDATGAAEVWRDDREVDALNNSLFRELLTYMIENPRHTTVGMRLIFCAKDLERMGDHVSNIAETVYYIVHGTPLPSEQLRSEKPHDPTTEFCQ